MARRNEHSPQQIKERVLQAAETLVNEEGLAALKVREIAMEIGYTVASIYAVFDNMADLILQLNGRTLDDLATQLAEIPPAQSPEQQQDGQRGGLRPCGCCADATLGAPLPCERRGGPVQGAPLARRS